MTLVMLSFGFIFPQYLSYHYNIGLKKTEATRKGILAASVLILVLSKSLY